MVNIFKLSILFLFLLTPFSHTQEKENPVIVVQVSGKKTESITLSDMEEKLKQYKITLYDPYYSKKKHYEAFKLKEFLDLVYGNNWKSGNYTDLTFHAYDGYQSVAVIDNLKNEGGYLVFRDLDYEDWEPISFTRSYPGPFYIVWTGKDQTAKNDYPWPWQLESINLVAFADQFPEIVPKTADKESSVYKGYEIFKARCLRCHSINREGGKVGPDLNAPRNILEYRQADFIKSYIKDPSEYRFTHMPDHKDLTDNQLDSLIDYLNYNMKENPWTFDEKN